MQRIGRYEASEIRFNLLALVADKREQAEKELARLHLLRAALNREVTDLPQSVCDELATLPSEDAVQARLVEVAEEIGNVEARVASEAERQNRWRLENERRRHNYVPLVFELLQQLAGKGMLEGMFKEAVAQKQKKKEDKKKDKKKE